MRCIAMPKTKARGRGRPPRDESQVDFGKLLRSMRTKKCWSAAACAAGTEMKISRWYTLEDGRGKPSIEELQAIAHYFGTTVDDLLKKV